MEIGFIYALGAAIVWGLVYTIDQKVLSSLNPLPLLFVYSIVTAIIVIPFILYNTSSVKEVITSGKTILSLIVICAFLTILGNFLILTGIKNMDASTASIIEISYPFFVVLFSYFIFHSTPNIYFFLGGLFIFIGSVIIIKLA